MLIDDIKEVIHRTPGLTATQIAEILFGPDGYHQRVASMCLALWEHGRVERRGNGGPGDPFTYYPGVERSSTPVNRSGRDDPNQESVP